MDFLITEIFQNLQSQRLEKLNLQIIVYQKKNLNFYD